MVRQVRRRLGASVLIGLWLLLGTACAYTYVPNAEGTPVLTLQISLTPTPTVSPATGTPLVPTPTALPATGTPLTPTPTPQPVLQRLTAPGCCSGMWWSADGTQVLYVDKPDERPAAIWGVDVATGEAAPYSAVVGVLQYNDRYAIALSHQTPLGVTLHDRQTGEGWALFGVGSLPFISPDGARVAYDGRPSQQTLFASRRENPIMVAALDGSNPRYLTTLYGVGIVGWFPDGSRLLALGMQNPDTERPTLWQVDADTGALDKFDDGAHLRNVSLSPDGAWLVFLKAFEEDPSLNTTWAMNVHTGAQQRLDFAVRYAWVGTESATLVYVPPRDAPDQGFGVWKLNVASGERTRLIDPEQTPLFIANGDWALAPDGKRIAFVSAQDYAIWLLEMSP